MRIALVHNFYRRRDPGGEDVVFEQERNLLREAGHDVVTYTRSNDDFEESSWSDRLTVAGILLGYGTVKREIADFLATTNPDVVHLHNVFPLIGASAFEAIRQYRIPVVQTIHNYRFSCIAATNYRLGKACELCSSESLAPGILHRCYRGSAASSFLMTKATESWRKSAFPGHAVDKFLVLTEFAARKLMLMGVGRERVIVKPNFVSVPKALRSSRHGAWDNSSRYAVFSGRLSEEKGVLDLVEAWTRVRGIALKIIGDGPLRRDVLRIVESGRLDVEVLGTLPRDDALAVVAGAEFIVVPSRWFEGMPMVVLEAWAMSVPVLASRIGGLAEMLGDDRRGLTFEPGNTSDLAAKINTMSNDTTLRAALGGAGLQMALSLSRENSLRALEEVYRSVIR